MNDALFQAAFAIAASGKHFVTSEAVLAAVGGHFSMPALRHCIGGSGSHSTMAMTEKIPSCLEYLFDVERRYVVNLCLFV